MIRINLLGRPRPKVKRKVAIAGTLQVLLFLIPLGLAVLLLGLHWTLIKKDIVRLDQDIQLKKAEKAEMGKLERDINEFEAKRKQLDARLNVISNLKTSQAGPTKLLEAVGNTVSLTDTLWLISMEEKTPNEIEFKGWAGSVEAVANFITNLNKSNYFENVEIKEAVQRPQPQGGGTNFEFTLSAKFKLPAAEPAAQPTAGGKT